MPSKRLVRPSAIAALVLGTVLAVPAAAFAHTGQPAPFVSAVSPVTATTGGGPDTGIVTGDDDWGWQ